MRGKTLKPSQNPRLEVALGNYTLGVDDGHGQWFGLRLDRFEPNREQARSVRLVWCLAGPWFRINYHRNEFGTYHVTRKPRLWLRLRWIMQRWRWQRATA